MAMSRDMPDPLLDARPDEPLPTLLHERAGPDLRTVYGGLFVEATRVQVAIRKIRLAGMSLGPAELASPRRIQVILAEINALTLASEAEVLALEADGRRRLEVLGGLLSTGVLEIRSAPLAGWAPDFSVFVVGDGGRRALLGPHWFHRPFPHRGPAFASLHEGEAAALAGDRFRELWGSAYDVGRPIQRTLEQTLERVPASARPSESRPGSAIPGVQMGSPR